MLLAGAIVASTQDWCQSMAVETEGLCSAAASGRPSRSVEAVAGVDCWRSPFPLAPSLAAVESAVAVEVSNDSHCCQCRRCQWTELVKLLHHHHRHLGRLMLTLPVSIYGSHCGLCLSHGRPSGRWRRWWRRPVAVTAVSAVAVSPPRSADGDADTHGCSPAITVTWCSSIAARAVGACQAPPPPRWTPWPSDAEAGVGGWPPLRPLAPPLAVVSSRSVVEVTGGSHCCQCRRCQFTSVGRWSCSHAWVLASHHCDMASANRRRNCQSLSSSSSTTATSVGRCSRCRCRLLVASAAPYSGL